MKKFFCYLALASMLITVGACNKNQIDGDDESLPNYPGPHVCNPAEFVHYPAVQPTATKNGNIEYWHCSECNHNYSDAEGAHLIPGNRPLTLAGNFSIPRNILDRANDILPFSSSGTVQTKSAAVTIISAIFDIVGLALTIEGQITTAMEFNTVKDQLSELMEQIGIIEESLDIITGKTNEIMSMLESAPYQDEVASVNNELKEVCKRTIETIENIEYIFASNRTLTPQVIRDVKYYAGKWYDYTYNGDNYETVTRRLLDDFQSKYISGTLETLPYTDIVKKCVKSYRIWEDDTYADRMQLLRMYQLTSGLSMIVLNIYRANCMPNGDLLNREDDESDFINMQNMISADSTRMAQALNSYRAFRDPSKDAGKQITYLEINPVKYDFSEWLKEAREDEDFVFVICDLGKMKNCLNVFLDKYKLRDPNAFISTADIDYVFNSTADTPLDSIFRKHSMTAEENIPIFGSYDASINGYDKDCIEGDTDAGVVGDRSGQYGFIRWSGEWKNHRAGGVKDHFWTDSNNTVADGCARYVRYGHFYNHTARDNESNELLCTYDHYNKSTGPLNCIMARDFRWNYRWCGGEYCSVGNCNREWSAWDAEGKYRASVHQTFMVYTGEKYDD